MFSVLGIVALVAMAFLYSMLTRHQALPSVQPAAQEVVQQSQPPQQHPAVVSPSGDVEPQAAPIPYTPPPSYDMTPSYEAPPPPPMYVHRTGRNRKMAGAADAAAVED